MKSLIKGLKKINNIILSASLILSLNVFVALAEKPQLGQEMRMEQKLQSNRSQFTLQHFTHVNAMSLHLRNHLLHIASNGNTK